MTSSSKTTLALAALLAAASAHSSTSGTTSTIEGVTDGRGNLVTGYTLTSGMAIRVEGRR